MSIGTYIKENSPTLVGRGANRFRSHQRKAKIARKIQCSHNNYNADSFSTAR